jgi:anaerobic selenocysteine-containing dehydrogenase
MPHALVQIHPDAAAPRGIRHGDAIAVATPHGRFTAHAELTPNVRPDVVCAQYGWWNPASPWAPREESYNEAIDGGIADAASGSNAMRAYLCEVTPIA